MPSSSEQVVANSIVFTAPSGQPIYVDSNGIEHVMTTTRSDAPDQVAVRVVGSTDFFFAPGKQVDIVVNPPSDVIVDLIDTIATAENTALSNTPIIELRFVVVGLADVTEFNSTRFETKLATMLGLSAAAAKVTLAQNIAGGVEVLVSIYDGGESVATAVRSLTKLELSSRLGVLIASSSARVPSLSAAESRAVPEWSFDLNAEARGQVARKGTRIVNRVASSESPATELLVENIGLIPDVSAVIVLVSPEHVDFKVTLFETGDATNIAPGTPASVSLAPSEPAYFNITPPSAMNTLRFEFENATETYIQIAFDQKIPESERISMASSTARGAAPAHSVVGGKIDESGSLGFQGKVRVELSDDGTPLTVSDQASEIVGIAPKARVVTPGQAEYALLYDSYIEIPNPFGILARLQEMQHGPRMVQLVPRANSSIHSGWNATPTTATYPTLFENAGEHWFECTGADVSSIVLVDENDVLTEYPNAPLHIPNGTKEILLSTPTQSFSFRTTVNSSFACIQGSSSHLLVHSCSYDNNTLSLLVEAPYLPAPALVTGSGGSLALQRTTVSSTLWWEYSIDDGRTFHTLSSGTTASTVSDRASVSNWVVGTHASEAIGLYYQPTLVTLDLSEIASNRSTQHVLFRPNGNYEAPPYASAFEFKPFVLSGDYPSASARETRFAEVTATYDLATSSNVDLFISRQTLDPEQFYYDARSVAESVELSGPWGNASLFASGDEVFEVPVVTPGPVMTAWKDRGARTVSSTRVVLQGGNTYLHTLGSPSTITTTWTTQDDPQDGALYSSAGLARLVPVAPNAPIRLRLVAGGANTSSANVVFAGVSLGTLTHSSADALGPATSDFDIDRVSLSMDTPTAPQPFVVESLSSHNKWEIIVADFYISNTLVLDLAVTKPHVSSTGEVSFETLSTGYPKRRSTEGIWPTYTHADAARDASALGASIKLPSGKFVAAGEALDVSENANPPSAPVLRANRLFLPEAPSAYNVALRTDNGTKARVSAIPCTGEAALLPPSALAINYSQGPGFFAKLWRARCVSATATVATFSVLLEAGAVSSADVAGPASIVIDLVAGLRVLGARVSFGSGFSLSTTDGTGTNELSVESSNDGIVWTAHGTLKPDTLSLLLFDSPRLEIERVLRNDVYELPPLNSASPVVARIAPGGTVYEIFDPVSVQGGSVLRISSANDSLGAWTLVCSGGITRSAQSAYDSISLATNTQIIAFEITVIDHPPANQDTINLQVDSGSGFVTIASVSTHELEAPTEDGSLPVLHTLRGISRPVDAISSHWLATRTALVVKGDAALVCVLEPGQSAFVRHLPAGTHTTTRSQIDQGLPSLEIPFTFQGSCYMLSFPAVLTSGVQVYQTSNELEFPAGGGSCYLTLSGLSSGGDYSFYARLRTGEVSIELPGNKWGESDSYETVTLLGATTSVPYRTATMQAEESATTFSFSAPVGGSCVVRITSSVAGVMLVGNLLGTRVAAPYISLPTGACAITALDTWDSSTVATHGMWVNACSAGFVNACYESIDYERRELPVVREDAWQRIEPHVLAMHTGGTSSRVVSSLGAGLDELYANTELTSVSSDSGTIRVWSQGGNAGPFRIASASLDGNVRLDTSNQVLLASALGLRSSATPSLQDMPAEQCTAFWPQAPISVRIGDTAFEARASFTDDEPLLPTGDFAQNRGLVLQGLEGAVAGDELVVPLRRSAVALASPASARPIKLYQKIESARLQPREGICSPDERGIFMASRGRGEPVLAIDAKLTEGVGYEFRVECLGFGDRSTHIAVRRGDEVRLAGVDPQVTPAVFVTKDEFGASYFYPDDDTPDNLSVSCVDSGLSYTLRVLPAEPNSPSRQVYAGERGVEPFGEARITFASRVGYDPDAVLRRAGEAASFFVVGDGSSWPFCMRVCTPNVPQSSVVVSAGASATTLSLADTGSPAVILANTSQTANVSGDWTGVSTGASGNVHFFELSGRERAANKSGVLLRVSMRPCVACANNSGIGNLALVSASERSGSKDVGTLEVEWRTGGVVRLHTSAPNNAPRLRAD